MNSKTQISHKIVTSLSKAISLEMDAMKELLGAFAVDLVHGKRGDDDCYAFTMLAANDKLVLGMDCTLSTAQGDLPVRLVAIDGVAITVKCESEVRHVDAVTQLVFYPWFIFEKLMEALEDDHFDPTLALTAFGQCDAVGVKTSLKVDHPGLNDSQLQAVQACSNNSLTFIWGPPGTGKTQTLGHVLAELQAQDYRILVTSTTNAAVDQVIARLDEHAHLRAAIARGKVVRIGTATDHALPLTVREITRRMLEDLDKNCQILKEHISLRRRQIENCHYLLSECAKDDGQYLLFESENSTIDEAMLCGVFSKCLSAVLVNESTDRKSKIVMLRQQRLDCLQTHAKTKLKDAQTQMRRFEEKVVHNASVVFSTLSNVTMNPMMAGESFDVVVIEEASMAVLPAVYASALRATKKVIIVGDPKQLPPIVQSRNPYVKKAMGRTIFEVTAFKERYQQCLVMLDIQYRMHPEIGSLVSTIFYEGRLNNAPMTTSWARVSACRPFRDRAVVLVDTAGKSRCRLQDNSYSRSNEKNAGLCVRLAQEAHDDGVNSIAIITPYAEQVRTITKLLSQKPHLNVECATVHRFQGHERDVVIFDSVDTAPLKPGALLTGDHNQARNILNVSLSRARGKLIVVADHQYYKVQRSKSVLVSLLASMRTVEADFTNV